MHTAQCDPVSRPLEDALLSGSASDLQAIAFRTTTATPKPVASVAKLAAYLRDGYWTGYANSIPCSWNGHAITYDVTGCTPTQAAAARAAFLEWARVANLTFIEQQGVSNITIATSAAGSGATTGFSQNASGILLSASIAIASDWDSGHFDPGGFGYETMMHEIGHALGLGRRGPDQGADGNEAAAAPPRPLQTSRAPSPSRPARRSKAPAAASATTGSMSPPPSCPSSAARSAPIPSVPMSRTA
jgi:hypothetical protein